MSWFKIQLESLELNVAFISETIDFQLAKLQTKTDLNINKWNMTGPLWKRNYLCD